MRRVIAARLAESKASIPHIYFSADVEVDGLAAVRAAVLARSGAKVSVNDCVVRAAALALAEVPAANAFWDAAAGAAAPSAGVDIAIAVATPGGLITPIVRGADAKGLAAIGAEVRELAGRARAGRLKPEEFQGGSFSISNLGMFGVDAFQAIVNPPQACILAVGGARAAARPGGPGGAPRAAQLVTLTLSADARVYDADVAAALLAALRRNLEEPARLLV
jgi:pyruvate dehydrogenase E2 component (dihydrolipoamide acetyltransferase)